jgi:hypothetical protein
MFEYVAFNPYNASPEAMASELTKKSSEGWEVVEILPTFDGRYCAFLRRPVSSSLDSSAVLGSSAVASVPAAVSTSSSNGSASVPAAWYADPSGRFELRYWNGKEWTEHVARSGQQFTDPPVA